MLRIVGSSGIRRNWRRRAHVSQPVKRNSVSRRTYQRRRDVFSPALSPLPPPPFFFVVEEGYDLNLKSTGKNNFSQGGFDRCKEPRRRRWFIISRCFSAGSPLWIRAQPNWNFNFTLYRSRRGWKLRIAVGSVYKKNQQSIQLYMYIKYVECNYITGD